VWDAIFGFLKPVFGIIDKAILDKTEAEKLKYALQAGVVNGEFDEFKTLVTAQMNVLVAEANGKGLKANWRPIIMLMFGFIVANNYIIFPYTELFGYKGAQLDIPPDLWQLLKLGIGGYIAGRSVEKVVPGVLEALKRSKQ